MIVEEIKTKLNSLCEGIVRSHSRLGPEFSLGALFLLLWLREIKQGLCVSVGSWWHVIRYSGGCEGLLS